MKTAARTGGCLFFALQFLRTDMYFTVSQRRDFAFYQKERLFAIYALTLSISPILSQKEGDGVAEYVFCFGLYRVRCNENSLKIFRRWPFKTEILIPTDEIAAVSTTQVIPQKVRVTKVFTSGKTVWILLSPKELANEIFLILSKGESDDRPV